MASGKAVNRQIQHGWQKPCQVKPSGVNIENSIELLSYLRSKGHIGSSENPMLRVLSGGVSSRTLLVERPNGESFVVKQAREKLQVASDWFSDPLRVHQEAEGLRWLIKLAPEGAITPLLFEDFDHHLIGMLAVPAPHENWKSMLLQGRVEEQHVLQFARLLGDIHKISRQKRSELAAKFDDRTFFESLRLEPYYAYSASREAAAADFLKELIKTTRNRRFCLTHGDYSPKNILIHKDKLVLVDHEVIHFGDPAFDLGFSLAHLLSKANHLSQHRTVFQAAAHLYWRTYLETCGDIKQTDAFEKFVIRHTLGCLLARVVGRSPLEYLGSYDCARQRRAVLHLITKPPQKLPELIEQFLGAVSQNDAD